MNSDLEIGFRKKPEDLEGFLKERGYEGLYSGSKCVSYEPVGEVWPQLFHVLDFVPTNDKFSNWQKAGYNIVSHLKIDFPEGRFRIKAMRLARQIGLKYDCVLFNPLETSDAEAFCDGRDIEEV